MNLLKRGLLLASLVFAFSVHAERQIAEIYQPTSLLGTDTEDEPLKDGQFMAATILCRPILIAGAFPESQSRQCVCRTKLRVQRLGSQKKAI